LNRHAAILVDCRLGSAGPSRWVFSWTTGLCRVRTVRR